MRLRRPSLSVALLAAACSESVQGLGHPPGDAEVARDASTPPDHGLPDAGPPCVPRPETCNQRDDDCDGAVDEELPIAPLTERITIRADEGSTGGCSTCALAFPAGLVAGDGFFAAWRLGFDGLQPRPNLYARRLDARGEPIEPVQRLFPERVFVNLRLGPWQSDRFLALTNERVGARNSIRTQWLDGAGQPVEGTFEVHGPGDWLPSEDFPVVPLPGGGAAWARDVREGVAVRAVDRAGRPAGAWTVEETGTVQLGDVSLASDADRVLVFYTSIDLDSRARLAHAAQLDADLEVLTEAAVEIPDDVRFGFSVALAEPDGWRVVAPVTGRDQAGLAELRVDADGDLSPPTLHSTELRFTSDWTVASARGGRHVVVAPVRLEDEDFEIWHTLVAELGDGRGLGPTWISFGLDFSLMS